jgi:predicted kinase
MRCDFNYISGKSYIQKLPGYTFKGIVYMSLDCGITWNYLGKKYPTPEIWTWCSGNVDTVTDYIKNVLLKSGFLPIFYTTGSDEIFVEKILSHFEIHPPCFIGMMPDLIHGLILKSWLGYDNKLKDTLIDLDCKFETESFIYCNIGPKFPKVKEKIQDKTAADLNIGHPNEYIDGPPLLIILVGQQGSGKSTVAKQFSDKGWVIIDEMYINNAKRKDRYSNSLQELINNIGCKGVGSKGVVIDAPNPKESDRKFLIDMALKASKKYIVGWVTRPGYYFNINTSVSAPVNVLESYVQDLETPLLKENGVRMV